MNFFSLSSGQKSVSALITAGPCYLSHVSVQTDGSNAGTIVVYDSEAASGKIVWEQKVEGSENIGGRNWQLPARCNVGLYAEISGTNATYIIELFADINSSADIG